MSVPFPSPQAAAELLPRDEFDQQVVGILREHAPHLPDGPVQHLRLIGDLSLNTRTAAFFIADLEEHLGEIVDRRINLASHTLLINKDPTLHEVMDFHYEALSGLMEQKK